MTTSATTYYTPGFSAVMRYFWPRLKPVILIYFAASVLLTAWWGYSVVHHQMIGYVIPSWVLTLMIGLSPLAFTRYPSRPIDITLPAGWMAKAGAMVLYTAVIVPAVVLIPPAVGNLIFADEWWWGVLSTPLLNNMEPEMLASMEHELIITNPELSIFISSLLPAMICLWLVLTLKRNVVLKSLIILFSLGILMSILTAIGSGYYVYHAVDQHFGDATSDISAEQVEAYVNTQVMPEVLHLIGGYYMVLMLIGLLMIPAIFLKVQRRQL